jgi:hypothetical protein
MRPTQFNFSEIVLTAKFYVAAEYPEPLGMPAKRSTLS